jgi:hypothetical protein
MFHGSFGSGLVLEIQIRFIDDSWCFKGFLVGTKYHRFRIDEKAHTRD